MTTARTSRINTSAAPSSGPLGCRCAKTIRRRMAFNRHRLSAFAVPCFLPYPGKKKPPVTIPEGFGSAKDGRVGSREERSYKLPPWLKRLIRGCALRCSQVSIPPGLRATYRTGIVVHTTLTILNVRGHFSTVFMLSQASFANSQKFGTALLHSPNQQSGSGDPPCCFSCDQPSVDHRSVGWWYVVRSRLRRCVLWRDEQSATIVVDMADHRIVGGARRRRGVKVA